MKRLIIDSHNKSAHRWYQDQTIGIISIQHKISSGHLIHCEAWKESRIFVKMKAAWKVWPWVVLKTVFYESFKFCWNNFKLFYFRTSKRKFSKQWNILNMFLTLLKIYSKQLKFYFFIYCFFSIQIPLVKYIWEKKSLNHEKNIFKNII